MGCFKNFGALEELLQRAVSVSCSGITAGVSLHSIVLEVPNMDKKTNKLQLMHFTVSSLLCMVGMQADNLPAPIAPPGSPNQPKGQPSVVSLRSRGIPILYLDRILSCKRQARSAQQQALDTGLGFVVFCQLQSWLSVYTLLVTLVSSILFGFKDGVEVSWGWVLMCFAMLLPLLGILVQVGYGAPNAILLCKDCNHWVENSV